MNNNLIYIVGFIALLLGFALAWFIKPSQHPIHDIESNVPEASPMPNAEVYTCSMHPHIRQNEPGLCPICEMDLIALASNSSNDPLVLQMTNDAVKLANIQTSIVGELDENPGREQGPIR